MEAQIATLRERIDLGFAAVNRRFDDQGDVQTQRHAENVGRLTRIEDEAKRTNGRVTTLEVTQRTNIVRIDELFTKLTRRRRASDEDDEAGIVNNRRITQRDVWVFFIGGGALWALIKLVGVLVHLAPAIDGVGK